MCTHFRLRSGFLLFVFIFCLTTAKVSFGQAANNEQIDIPVVVNILDNADASKIDEGIAKASDIFKQKAGINLDKKATDPNAKGDTNGDGGLDRNERDKVREDGQKVLNDTPGIGAGKGIKIDVVNDVDINNANNIGLSVHRNPVIIIEPDTDVNELAKTIVHEICHVLTLNYDVNDPCSIMYKYKHSGTNFDVNEVNEVRDEGKKRGTSYFITPDVLPRLYRRSWDPEAIDYGIDGFGAILDNFHDVNFYDPRGLITDQNDPTIQYADIGEVTVFADEPFETGDVVKTTIQLGTLPDGNWAIDSFFDIYFQSLGRAHIELHNWIPVSAIWYDANGNPTAEVITAQVSEELEFRGLPHHGEPHNKTLLVDIPIRLVQDSLVGGEPIVVNCNSQHLDHRADPIVIVLTDYTLPFNFGLSHPSAGPKLSFTANNKTSALDPNGDIIIFGDGFKPYTSGHIRVESGSSVLINQAVTVPSDGKISMSFGCSTLKPNSDGWFKASFQPDYYGSPENAPQGATGYFKYCPEGEMEGDIDGDYDVDWQDFRIVANDWLKISSFWP
jgi:hypothetical protein